MVPSCNLSQVAWRPAPIFLVWLEDTVLSVFLPLLFAVHFKNWNALSSRCSFFEITLYVFCYFHLTCCVSLKSQGKIRAGLHTGSSVQSYTNFLVVPWVVGKKSQHINTINHLMVNCLKFKSRYMHTKFPCLVLHRGNPLTRILLVDVEISGIWKVISKCPWTFHNIIFLISSFSLPNQLTIPWINVHFCATHEIETKKTYWIISLFSM